jgi:hypothetical protein
MSLVGAGGTDAPHSEVLEGAVLDALRPTGLRDRLHAAVTGGYTVLQIFERLHAAVRSEIEAGPAEPVLAARQGVDRVRLALVALVATGRVRRKKVSYGMQVNTKGGRGMVVDVYRRA